jgi:glycosyltransferase involved in cell wall biosynthesis
MESGAEASSSRPKVSVIIPVFNRPEAVRRAIESVLAQTCQDFEIIVVDDASTDATPAVVAAFADSRISLIRHERNRGGSAARNTGIRASSAPYVGFLDSDDEWLPHKLERQLAVFEGATDQVGLVYAGAERVYEDGVVSRDLPRSERDLTRTLLLENVIGETSVGMVRRSVLDQTGGFDESLPSCQDLDLWLRISERFHCIAVSEVLVRVVKGSDRNRISANVPRTVLGREMYCRKHREKLIQYGVLHRFLRESGWWQQRRVRDARLARRFYLESIRAKPLAPWTYVLLLVSYQPMTWLDFAARCKHQITRWRNGMAARRLAASRDPFAADPPVQHTHV